MSTTNTILVMVAVLTFGFAWLLGSSLWGMFHTRGSTALYCTTCGQAGRPNIKTRGSIGIEIVLWFCLVVPGLIYSIWRVTTRYKTCEHCGATTLVPANSPVAAAHRKQFSP